MKGWNRYLLAIMVVVLLLTAACSRGIPQADYDKAKADLAAAQSQATNLGTQLATARASLDKATADLAQAKADAAKAKTDSDKAKADLATAQAGLQALQNNYNTAVAERDKARADLVPLRTDADKAKADLAAAQARVQKLESDLSLADAQVKQQQADIGSAKASLDAARADLATAQARVQKLETDLAQAGGGSTPGTLAAVQSYVKITDLAALDPYRQALGLKSSYQLTDVQMQDEMTRLVLASNDPILKALWEMGADQGSLVDFGNLAIVYDAIAVDSVVSGKGAPKVFPPASMAVNPSPTGQSLLQVKLSTVDGKPVSGVDVGLWYGVSPLDPPNAGVATTNALGVASFTVKDGVHWVDFNPDTYPTTLALSSGRLVLAAAGMTTQVELLVEPL